MTRIESFLQETKLIELECDDTKNCRLFETFRKLPVDCLPPDLFIKTSLVQATPQPGTKKPNGAPNPAGYDLAGATAHLGMSQRKLRRLDGSPVHASTTGIFSLCKPIWTSFWQPTGLSQSAFNVSEADLHR